MKPKLLERFVPSYSVIPAICMIVVGFSTYFTTKLLTDGCSRHYDISLPIDRKIPLIPIFIVIYIISYAQWFLGYWAVAREEKTFARRVFSAEIIAKGISLAFFLAMPTIMVREPVVGTDIFSRLTAMIYSADTPTNLFPSLHCLESWILFRSAFGIKKLGKWVIWAHAIFGILVFFSVLFVRQHLILDIPGAIIVGELSLYIARRFKTERIFDKIDSIFKRKEQD